MKLELTGAYLKTFVLWIVNIFMKKNTEYSICIQNPNLFPIGTNIKMDVASIYQVAGNKQSIK